MKTIITFITLCFVSFNLFSQTSVNGEQSGTWTISGSPYYVTDSIVVPAGQTLTVEAGVTVNFQGNYKFHVAGKLIAIGTETDSIFFTTNNQSTGWGGIRFDETSEISELSYCKIEYGKTISNNFPDQHGGGIMLNNSDILLNNCVFENNEATGDDNGMGGAIYALNSTSQTQIIDCTFKNNHSYGEGGAIKLSGDNGANIENCKFINNSVFYGGGGICLYGCYNTHIYKCLFAGNYTTYSAGGAAFLEGYSQGVMFVNCTMINNQAQNGDGGGVEIAFSDASFTNSIIYNNNGAYSDNIYLDYGYAEINYCNTSVPDDATGTNNINVDAQFVNPATGDFHLSENSPCIDAGIDSLTITDAYNQQITVIDLNPDEYYNTAPDMGCYEYGMTENIKTLNNSVSIYPNPADGILNIQTEKKLLSVEISDISGKTVLKNKFLNSNNNIVDISGLKNGIYFLNLLFADNSVLNKKVIVSK